MEKQVLITHVYTADPSAHVFDGELYIYPSHDRDIEMESNDNGDQYDMNDYHVFHMDDPSRKPRDCGICLHLDQVPWASRQLWAPDAARKDGKTYLYFPARDKDQIFRIGVAVSDSPEGPFRPRPEPIRGSFSIDPCVFVDDDGKAYMSFGGLWGGQLEKWQTGSFDPEGSGPGDNEPALCPKVALLAGDMLEFSGEVRDLVILDENGFPLRAGDEARRYFEGPWMHKYRGKYYFSWSTGTTHTIQYAMADNPLGPYTWKGTVLTPVLGWTTHHSIVEWRGKSWLFYHDCSLSGGINHKRNLKFCELKYEPDGTIQTINP